MRNTIVGKRHYGKYDEMRMADRLKRLFHRYEMMMAVKSDAVLSGPWCMKSSCSG